MKLKKHMSVLLSILLSLSGNSIFALDGDDIVDNNREPKIATNQTSKFNSNLNKVAAVAIPVGFYLAAFTGLRYLINYRIFYEIFNGISSRELENHEKEGVFNCTSINYGDLRGSTINMEEPAEMEKPAKNDLKDKCVLAFSSEQDSAALMIEYVQCLYGHFRYYPLRKLLVHGAKLVGIDYRGWGNSKNISKWRISESTVYADGEKMYNYVRNELGFEPKDIILYAHGVGGAVATHVLKYASNKGEKLCGVILASPIKNSYTVISPDDFSSNSIYSYKFKSLIAKAITREVIRKATIFFNTEENLRKVRDEHKNIPIFICSGDGKDSFSLCKTDLYTKMTQMGYTNVTGYMVPDCHHEDIWKMFDFAKDCKKLLPNKRSAVCKAVDEFKQKTPYDEYISKLATNKT
ncbi:MAG: serine aminopeptidase domain-containing protein, partial [Acutalibacteraceae bacterium]